jgi:hypothetical protein
MTQSASSIKVLYLYGMFNTGEMFLLDVMFHTVIYFDFVFKLTTLRGDGRHNSLDLLLWRQFHGRDKRREEE